MKYLGAPQFLDFLWLIIVAILLVIAIVVFCVLVPIKTYFRALFSGCHVSSAKLYSMRSRGIDYNLIVDEYIYAKKAGLRLNIEELETHKIGGGNLRNVINGLIASENAQVNLSFDTAKALDLAGRNVSSVVQDNIKPRLIPIPSFSAWTVDGKELKLQIVITVRANIDRFLSGTSEETLISRVQEGVICAVCVEKYSDLMDNLDIISKTTKLKNLDKNCAFDLVDLSLVKVETGRDLERERERDEEEYESRLSVSRAEEARIKEEIKEQQLKVEAQKLINEKLANEAEIPKSIIKAFEEGKLDMLDFVKMQNLIADTNMRKEIVNNFSKPKKEGSDKN